MIKNRLFLILLVLVCFSGFASAQDSPKNPKIIIETDEGVISTESFGQFQVDHADIYAGIKKTEGVLLPLIENTQLVLKIRIVESHKGKENKRKPLYVRYDLENPQGSTAVIGFSKDSGATTDINMEHTKKAVAGLAQ
jgi:hypothetical protein